MAHESIRKQDSLLTTTSRIREEFKKAHGKYNDRVSDLAILAKNELKRAIKYVSENNNMDKTVIDSTMQIFNQIDDVLLDLEEIHFEIDEIISVIGGLEFSSTNTIEKLAEIFNNLEQHQNRMIKGLNILKEDVQKYYETDHNNNLLFDDLKEFQLEFSRLQDFIIEAIPRMSSIFDELDKEENLGKKYQDTKHV